MKAVQVTTQPGGRFKIEKLPLPSIQRRGDTGAEKYRQQAKGGTDTKNFTPLPADFLRTIVLSEGRFNGLATEPRPLLTAVMSGAATLQAGTETAELQIGDLVLTDGKSTDAVALQARGIVRLVQLGISAEFPGEDAEIQPPGAATARPEGEQILKRVYRGAGTESAFFADFPEIFPATRNDWSRQYSLRGFRMIYWDQGEMDYHPCVLSQMGIFLSGEHRTDVRGGGGQSFALRAGDICLTEDTTGEGHLNRVTGGCHAIVIVLGENDNWPLKT